MLSVISPVKFREDHVEKLASKMVKKEGLFRREPIEEITRKSMVWMPYYRVKFNYGYSEEDSLQKYGETALNAMFYGCVTSEKELFMLFRPNYLKYKIIAHSPQSREIVGSTVYVDLEEFLGGFLRRLNEVKDELNKLRSELNKIRANIRKYSGILPIAKDVNIKEKTLSEKVAKLHATKNILSMCLNITDDVRSIRVLGHDVFYYPNLVVTLKDKKTGSERYFIMNLVEDGLIRKQLSYDKGLTELCNKNSVCREAIANTIMSTS